MGPTRPGKRTGLGRRLLRWTAPLALLAILPVIAGALLPRFGQSASHGPLVCRADRKTFVHEVPARGDIASAVNVDVVCEVKARGSSALKIIQLVPEGTFVKPGDFLCKLDSSGLEDDLVSQQIRVNDSAAELVDSTTDYQVALASKEEYLNGLYLSKHQDAEMAILKAKEEVRQSQEQFESGRKLDELGFITPLQREADRFALKRSQDELHAAEVAMQVLEKYSKAKQLKLLDSHIAIVSARLKSREHIHKIEQEELKTIQENIAKCTIRSPAAGQVVYAHLYHNGHSHLIQEGQDTMEGRVMFRLPNPEQMQVVAKIREENIAFVRPGMTVRITTDAIPGVELRGEVQKVNEYPEPMDFFGPNVNQYETTIRITTPAKALRPGLTADVNILVDRRDNQLQLPLQAIVKDARKNYCITHDHGVWQPHEVELGSSNGKYVIVHGGIEEGQEVVLNAAQYRKLAGLSQAQDAASASASL